MNRRMNHRMNRRTTLEHRPETRKRSGMPPTWRRRQDKRTIAAIERPEVIRAGAGPRGGLRRHLVISGSGLFPN